MAASPHLLLAGLRYAYPTFAFVYFFLYSAITTCTFQKPDSKIEHPRRRLIKFLMLAVAGTFSAQCILALTHWHTLKQDVLVSLLACAMVYGLQFVILHDTKHPIWYSYVGSWAIALVFDPILAVLSLRHRDQRLPMSARAVDTLCLATRVTFLVIAVVVFFIWQRESFAEAGSDTERQSLLRKDRDSEDTLITEYGSTDSEDGPGKSTSDPESDFERSQRLLEENRDKRLQESGNWLAYAKSFKLFFPYVWPVNDRRLQVYAGLVGLCLLANNAFNVLIPNQLGVVLRTLQDASKDEDTSSSWNPWIQVIIFAFLKLSASTAGISMLRQRLWLPVEQYAERAMVEAAHSHILNLDAQFHDTKSLSDMLMAIQNGEAISSLLETICFEMVPNLIDLGVAFIYLTVKFGPWEGLITISTSTIFIYLATHALARSRTGLQAFSKAWYEEWYIMNSGFTGWTTVASFNQVPHESSRFSKAVRDRIAKSRSYTLEYLSAQAVQYLVLSAGLLAGLLLAVWQVTRAHSIDASDFVVLLTYWGQLVTPLNFFAQLGKQVNRKLIDAERLVEIMETKPKVTSKPNAPSFHFEAGRVEFQDVQFSYDKKKEILKNLSFTVKPGETIAFVGQTGAGKSTILKLLNRFYDVTDGCIKIDGQDIRDVDLHSLRAHFGVVPQNPVLFNDSVMDNVRYARLDASDEEVHDACKAAAIHDQIIGFTDGYRTRVGERGMKLSGGELQRVAIARAILKKPKMVLLDEATSAIDTETESKIQYALRRLCKNRTTFIVAHRLSTIVNADRIVVVNNGMILEQGTHESLIAAGGKYAELWAKQIFVKPKDFETDKGDTSDDQNSVVPKKSTTAEDSPTKSTIPEVSTQDDDGQPAEVKTPSGQRREGSSLNPSAPEFTPRSMLAAACSPTGKAMIVGHDPFSQTLTPVHIQQSSIVTPVVSLPRPIEPLSIESFSDEVTVNAQQSAKPTAKRVVGPRAGQEGQKRKVSYKIPRYVRRNQSRSEPSDSRTATS